MSEIDILSAGANGYEGGNVAMRLLSNGMNPSALRTAATLRKDEWELLDKVVVEVARQRLVGVADLMSRGLSFKLTNPLGTLVLQHETLSEMTAAEVSMDAVTPTARDRVEFNLVNTPLPIVHKDFTLTARNLESSRRLGQPLDTTSVAEASRQVVEKIEDMLFNGLSSGGILGFGTSTASLYGYRTHPSRNTVSIGTAWDDAAVTGSDILDDVLAMVTAAQADMRYGPYMLYVPSNYWVLLQDDFKSNSDKTILQRLKEISGIVDVKVADKLPEDNVLLIEMARDVVDMVDGIQPMVVSWDSQGGMVMNFKVLAIMVPRIKADYNGNCGVVHMS